MQENQDITFDELGFPTPEGQLPVTSEPIISTPSYDPIVQKDIDMSKQQVDYMKKAIKQKSLQLSAFDKMQVGNNSVQQVLGAFKDRRANLVDYEVELDEAYTRLHDGTYVPKFENYISGTNNEERLASAQSGWEQTINGIGKGITKTGLNILDGTVGTVVGLVNGIKEGSLSAVYNNGFSNYIDDLNTKMDYQLPNYYTQEQKNMSFLRSMGTANFWANDFLGGMSFMLGTIGSEAIWALATGGASLTVALPKVALKAGAKGLAKGLGKQSAKNFYKNSLKMLKAYNRTIPYSTAGKAFNNARFLYTSAGYEAGVEARHSLNQSLESFISSYEQVHGRRPNGDEYAEFMDAAVDNSNKVFASNVALVGASNIAQFGTYFGIGTGLTKKMTKAFGRTFGLGITKTLDDSGKIIYEALKPNRLQRIAGKTAAVLKAPFVEGFVEEGGQSVISKTSEKWLASRFNPDALRENFGVIDAATESFSETYTTKEGFKEVGLGMLIGFFGGAGKRGATGQRTPFNIGEYSGQVQLNEKLVEDLNNVNSKFTDSQVALLERLTLTNQFNSYLTKSKKEADKGNLFQSSIDWDTSQYTKMLIENRAGMLDDSVEDFKRVTNSTPDSSFIEDYGMTAEQAQEYKAAMIDNYTKNVKLFKKASKIAEAVKPEGSDLEFNKTDYTQELALNIYLGARAGERAGEIAESIDEVIGTRGIASALRLYTNLNKKAQRRADRIVKLDQELKDLEQEYATIQNTFTASDTNKAKRTEENQKVAQELTAKEKRSNKILAELQNKRNQLTELEGELEGRFYKSKFHFGGNLNIFNDVETDEALISDEDLKNSVLELNKLDKYRELLRKESPKVADQVDTLREEYVKNVKAFRDFNLVYEQMADPRFARNSYKGLIKLFGNVGTDFKDADLDQSFLDVETEKLNQVLSSNEKNLSEDQKFTLKTLHRMSTAFYLNVKVGDYTQETETVSNEAYEEFVENKTVSDELVNSIANKLVNKGTLTQREQDIYDGKKDTIDETVEEIKLEEGDDIVDVTQETTEKENDNNTLIGRLKNIIENVKKSNRYLRDFDVNDFNTESKPTNKNYEEFDKLFQKIQSGKYTPADQKKFNKLKTKINNWGKLEGTLTPDKVLLSDLLEQVSLLESQILDTNTVLPTLTDLNDLVDVNEFEATNRNNNYDNLQTYDKAMVSKNSFGDYLISNISINGLLGILESNAAIRVEKNKRVLSKPDKGWNISNITEGQRFSVEISLPEGNQKLVFKIGSGNNLVVSENTKSKLNTLTKLKIYPSNNLPTNYQPLLKEVDLDGEMKLVPVDTDFKFEDNLQMSTEKVNNLSENDLVYLEASTKDSYNKKLLKAYNDATGEQKEEALRELENNLVIYVKDKKNNFVGVHKSTGSGIVSKRDTNFETLQKIRKIATQRVIEENFLENQVFDLGMSIPVSQVYFGHPNFNITTVDGKTFVKENEFTSEQLEKVTDIGYVLNGALKLRNKSKNAERYPFLTNILKSKRYKGRKVPVIVFDYNGHKVAYPVSLKPVDTDVSGKLDDIVDSNLSIHEKVLKLNNLLMTYGIDVNKNGFTFDNYNQKQLVKVKELLKESKDYPELEEWLKDEIPMNDVLTAQSTINIDIADKPFHSPKIRTKINKVNGLNSSAIVDTTVEEVMEDTLENEVKSLQQESC